MSQLTLSLKYVLFTKRTSFLDYNLASFFTDCDEGSEVDRVTDCSQRGRLPADSQRRNPTRNRAQEDQRRQRSVRA